MCPRVSPRGCGHAECRWRALGIGLTFTYAPENPVPTVGGAIQMPYPPTGTFEQRTVEKRADVLVFTSDVLTGDAEVMGWVTATLTAATDCLTTDWVVRLCDVHPYGRSFNVVAGITRVEAVPWRGRHGRGRPVVDEQAFQVGHRIRVQVTSSCFPRWDRNPNTAD
ncbi:CocE/NonD family hydrolase [Streptomyces sp. NPDC047042]|uniref:CocE/NonD family hydrolase n=1 Tax=Streptomyces sp. NPDC047042 TaxID=3154807 RepID=UPI0033D1009B